jgi:hypothetical protein
MPPDSLGSGVGQKRDLTGIETRNGRKGQEAFRAYVADPARPGRKLKGPWGPYEQAHEWRARALRVKADAKRRAQAKRTELALERLGASLLEPRDGG